MLLEKVKVIQLLPLQTGQGRNGEWRKQEVIVETTNSQYPKKLCVSFWGDKIENQKLQVGNVLNIDIDVESREYNSRWYTDVKAWRTEVAQSTGQQEQGFTPAGGMDQSFNAPPIQGGEYETSSHSGSSPGGEESSIQAEDLPF